MHRGNSFFSHVPSLVGGPKRSIFAWGRIQTCGLGIRRNVENISYPPRAALIALASWDFAAFWPHRVGFALSLRIRTFLRPLFPFGAPTSSRPAALRVLILRMGSGFSPRILLSTYISLRARFFPGPISLLVRIRPFPSASAFPPLAPLLRCHFSRKYISLHARFSPEPIALFSPGPIPAIPNIPK